MKLFLELFRDKKFEYTFVCFFMHTTLVLLYPTKRWAVSSCHYLALLLSDNLFNCDFLHLGFFQVQIHKYITLETLRRRTITYRFSLILVLKSVTEQRMNKYSNEKNIFRIFLCRFVKKNYILIQQKNIFGGIFIPSKCQWAVGLLVVYISYCKRLLNIRTIFTQYLHTGLELVSYSL